MPRVLFDPSFQFLAEFSLQKQRLPAVWNSLLYSFAALFLGTCKVQLCFYNNGLALCLSPGTLLFLLHART